MWPYNDRHYFVKSTGSDSNSGTYASPFLTVAHAFAITRPWDIVEVLDVVSEIGLTIPVAVALIGADPENCLVEAHTGSVITMKTESYIKGLQLLADAEDSLFAAGIVVSGTICAVIEDMIVGGTNDSLFNGPGAICRGLEVRRSTFTATYDAIQLQSATDFLLDRVQAITDCSYGLYQGVNVDSRAFVGGASTRGRIIDSSLAVTKASSVHYDKKMYAFACAGKVKLENCDLVATNAWSGQTDIVACIGEGGATSVAKHINIEGCRFTSSSNGTGPVWDIYNVAGNIYNRGAAGFSPAKVNGAVIYLPTDTTNWKGAAAPALTGDPFAQINTKIPRALPDVAHGSGSGLPILDVNSKLAAKYDWATDVTNKPTIGTSTLTTSDVDARLTAFPVQKSNVAVTAPANMALDSTVAKSATALTNATWTDAKAALIDASIASRNATAPPSASDNATLVASTLASAHGAGSWTTATGFATPTDLGLLASYGDSHWSTATGFALASVWTPTKAGYLDAAISSRSTYSGGSVDFSPVTNYLNGTTPINAASLVNVPSVAMSDADKAALAASIAGDIPPPDLTGISTTLGQIKNKTDQITSGNFTITNAVSANGKQLFLNVGNAYTIANGHQLTWHGVFPADIAGATLKIWSDGDFSGIVVQATSVSPTAVTFELTAAQTNSLTACLRPTYHFALWDDQEFTEITGLVTVTRVQ